MRCTRVHTRCLHPGPAPTLINWQALLRFLHAVERAHIAQRSSRSFHGSASWRFLAMTRNNADFCRAQLVLGPARTSCCAACTSARRIVGCWHRIAWDTGTQHSSAGSQVDASKDQEIQRVLLVQKAITAVKAASEELRKAVQPEISVVVQA